MALIGLVTGVLDLGSTIRRAEIRYYNSDGRMPLEDTDDVRPQLIMEKFTALQARFQISFTRS